MRRSAGSSPARARGSCRRSCGQGFDSDLKHAVDVGEVGQGGRKPRAIEPLQLAPRRAARRSPSPGRARTRAHGLAEPHAHGQGRERQRAACRGPDAARFKLQGDASSVPAPVRWMIRLHRYSYRGCQSAEASTGLNADELCFRLRAPFFPAARDRSSRGSERADGRQSALPSMALSCG